MDILKAIIIYGVILTFLFIMMGIMSFDDNKKKYDKKCLERGGKIVSIPNGINGCLEKDK